MTFIEVKSAAPEAPANWQDGTYVLLLKSISDPKTVLAQKGQMAGQEVDLIDWGFAIDDASSPFNGLEIQRSTSTRSGPKSAMFPILTALLGGRAPVMGQKFSKEDLIGRRVFGSLRLEESGYIRVDAITALPASMLQQAFAAATGAPTSTPLANGALLNLAPTPVAAAVGVGPTEEPEKDDLPF